MRDLWHLPNEFAPDELALVVMVQIYLKLYV